jgi:hypothetical protein
MQFHRTARAVHAQLPSSFCFPFIHSADSFPCLNLFAIKDSGGGFAGSGVCFGSSNLGLVWHTNLLSGSGSDGLT